jgi:hypothetical protein
VELPKSQEWTTIDNNYYYTLINPPNSKTVMGIMGICVLSIPFFSNSSSSISLRNLQRKKRNHLAVCAICKEKRKYLAILAIFKEQKKPSGNVF